ncbi:MAG: hypothetical protein R8G01_09270 [Ilumatobacteraceae bacterium]|nr:hypothetical protein [Ilumatobacteraceae bacterium]
MALLVSIATLVGCSADRLPAAEQGPASTTEHTAQTTDTDSPSPRLSGDAAGPPPTPPDEASSAAFAIDLTAPGRPIDDRVFGTNVPAWLGPDTLASDWFRTALAESGATTIRMPGGSWSTVYGWSACERRLDDGCIWEGAARPSDFAALLSASGLHGIWTVSPNETAQSAAAVVSFFNGDRDDDTVIGVDRNGVDWGTVADWAGLRAEGGHTEPVRVAMWEVGNEVYGARQSTGGGDCAPFGWEEAWTCDGAEYVTGNELHDGYLDIRAEMLAVDPTIEVGAVGVREPSSWGDWGNEVLEAADGEIDFYIVHHYAYDQPPDIADASRAATQWPDVVADAREGLPDDVPLAITEYNLVAFEAGDTTQTMTKVGNALFIADTLGRLASAGVPIANQWNLANGTTESGTDYGLVSADGSVRFPQFHALATWAGRGPTLLEVDRGDQGDEVEVYATQRADGTLALIAIHFSDDVTSVPIVLEGAPAADGTMRVTAHVGENADAEQFAQAVITDDAFGSGALEVELGPWSINLIELRFDG